MGFSVPLEWVLGIIVVLLAALPSITYFVLWALVPFLNVQLFNNLFKNDTILRDDGEKVVMLKGEKKDRESSLYRVKKGLLGMGQVKYIGIDPTKWDNGNGSRFGGSTLRYQYPGKMWLKNLPRMFATELHLEVAKVPVREEDTKNNNKAIIKHNKYLHMIAIQHPDQALKLLRCETKADIEKYAREYIVIPPDVDKTNQAAIEKIVADTVQEALWVQEYCSTLPREVDMAAMMSAYPDQESCWEISAKIMAECQNEAKASSQFNIITMFMIIGGIVLISGLVEIITIIMLK